MLVCMEMTMTEMLRFEKNVLVSQTNDVGNKNS